MNDIFTNLIERHTQPVGQIIPRLPGIYESEWKSFLNFGFHEANQLAVPVEENPGTVRSQDELINEVYNKRTISNSKSPNKRLQVYNEEDQFISMNKLQDSHREEQPDTVEKPVTEINNENQKNPEKMKSDNQLKNEKSDINIFQIKPKYGVTRIHQNRTERSKIPGDDIIHTLIQPEKQVTAPGKKMFQDEVERKAKMPDRFTQWMNEPVKQSQSRKDEISPSQTIKINIGTIEVKAIMESNRLPVIGKPAFKPKLSLDDYLNQRNGRKQ